MAVSEELAVSAAEAAKVRGNELFGTRDYEGAVKAYTEAIELDPPPALKLVLYSNRSGAYLAWGEAKSKALKDAEACVGLDESWAKGWGRLGAAQSSLGRYAEAQASYLKASALDEKNQTYQAGLEAAKRGEARATQARIAAEQEAARQEAAREAAANEARRAREEEDGTLAAFFSAVGNAEQARKRAAKPVTQKYVEQALGTPAENIARLTEKFAEFKNLDPFRVLKLDVDATVDDVKMRYRKLSALCHPDKNLDDSENARQAFEAVKSAYQTLVDQKQRDRCVLVVQGARERARLQNPHADEETLAKEVMKTFAQNEMKRRDVEEHRRVYAARERAQADEAKKKDDDEKKFEEEWNQDERRKHRIDFWQQFQDDANRASDQKRLRTARNFKMQKVEAKQKFGQAELETWKRDWK